MQKERAKSARSLHIKRTPMCLGNAIAPGEKRAASASYPSSIPAGRPFVKRFLKINQALSSISRRSFSLNASRVMFVV